LSEGLPEWILFSRTYWEFENFMFTLEHLFGKPIFLLMRLLPSAMLAPPYCHLCKRDWFQILEEDVLSKKYTRFLK